MRTGKANQIARGHLRIEYMVRLIDVQRPSVANAASLRILSATAVWNIAGHKPACRVWDVCPAEDVTLYQRRPP